MIGALADAPSTPFRVPPGISLVRVNAETGQPARAGDAKVIWEAFLPGTAPTGEESTIIGGGTPLLGESPGGGDNGGLGLPTVGGGGGSDIESGLY